MTNVAPPAVPQNMATATVTATEEVTEAVEVEDDADRQERQEPSSSTAPETWRKVSKKQQYNAKLSEHILQLAGKEDDQFDLELVLGARMKLNSDEIDDLLDEIKDVTSTIFHRKRRQQEVASVSIQPAPCTPANAVLAVPPPPLQKQPQKQVQQDDQQGGPEVLFDMTGRGSMPGYDMQFVTDPENNNTYMKLN